MSGRKAGIAQPGRVLWTAEDDAALLEGCRRNLPIVDICALTGRSKHAVMSRQRLLRERGVDVSRPRPRCAGPRGCLRCGKTFNSAGAHNRICQICRSTADSLDCFTTPARVAL